MAMVRVIAVGATKKATVVEAIAARTTVVR